MGRYHFRTGGTSPRILMGRCTSSITTRGKPPGSIQETGEHINILILLFSVFFFLRRRSLLFFRGNCISHLTCTHMQLLVSSQFVRLQLLSPHFGCWTAARTQSQANRSPRPHSRRQGRR